MSNVMRTRHQVYPKKADVFRVLPSVSRPATPRQDPDSSAEIQEQQEQAYREYHEACRNALALYFSENPDKNWNYIERLRKIWETGNHPSSVLAPDMRIKLSSNVAVRREIDKLYRQYNAYPAHIADNFETPRRVTKPRVSFVNQPSNSTTSEPRISAASTSGITFNRGAPRPSSRLATSEPSPTPYEASSKTLQSLVEPAEGEYRLNPPKVSRSWEAEEQPESPSIQHRQRIYEREDTRNTPITSTTRTSIVNTPALPTMEVMTPSRIPLPPTPYAVHHSYEVPMSSFAYSDPGLGRRQRSERSFAQSPRVQESLADIFSQEAQRSEQYPSLSSIPASIIPDTPRTTESKGKSPQRLPVRESNSSITEESTPPKSQERMSAADIDSLISGSPVRSHSSSPKTNEPIASTSAIPIQSPQPSTTKTLVNFDEDLLNYQSYFSHRAPKSDLDNSEADAYYDNDWQHRGEYKYILGKTPGRVVRTADGELVTEPNVIPESVESSEEQERPTREDIENWRRPQSRLSFVRDVPPHQDRISRSTSRSHLRSHAWKQQEENTFKDSTPVSGTKPAWRKATDRREEEIPQENRRRPYRWVPETPQATQHTGGAPPGPPDSPDDDDDGEPWDRRNRPSRNYGGGGGNFPDRSHSGGSRAPPTGGSGGMGGGGGPPDDPGNGNYDDRESEDSDNFPHHNVWPPYGIFYRAKPPNPKSEAKNAADYYGMPPYHFNAGWPRPQEYHHTRHLPEGEDKWVWQEKNGKSQQDLNREAKLNLKLPSSFNGLDRRKWKSFLAECLVHFQAKPTTYKEDSSKIAFAAALLEGPALTHYTTTLQQNSTDRFFFEWSIFVERMGAMFGLVNQRAQAQRKIHHMRMREDERFPNYLTRFQEEAFDCGFNEVALKAALRYTLADRMLTRLQYSPEPKEYPEFVNLLINIDARYWEIRDSLEDRDRNRSGGSRYYNSQAGYYGASSNANQGFYKQNYRRKNTNSKKFNRREKAKGVSTSEDDSEEDSDTEDDESDDDDPYMDIDFIQEEAPQPIDDLNEVRTQFRRLYVGAKDDIKEILRRLSPQEKEERMRKGLCLYCGKPGHIIANCPLIQQKEKGRVLRSQEEQDIWSQDDGPLNWKAIQPEEQC